MTGRTEPTAPPGLTAGWPDLLAIALVGTQRRQAATGPGSDEAAAALLDQAAAWTVYRRAGIQAVHGLVRPQPTPADPTPIAGRAAATWLAMLLDVQADPFGLDHVTRAALLAEWLTVAAARGRRVPPELLPDLLDLGRRQHQLRPLVAAAGGPRVRWLAGQNPDWAYLAPTADHPTAGDLAAWQEAPPRQRAAVLTEARRADPAAARALLAEHWPTLAPDERRDLLGTLATGLEPGDEDVLERALDDRRAEVRATAARLLARLPDSALNRRMAGRARACLSRGPGHRLVVEPPVECDPGMRRDGISPRPSDRTGERAWWLVQLLAAAPLATWTTAVGARPALATGAAEFLALSVADDWAATVHRGLAHAAAGQANPEWAAALLDVMHGYAGTRPAGRHRWPVQDLYSALAPDELVHRTIAALPGPTAGQYGPLLEHMLRHCPAPWPDQLSQAVLTAAEEHARHERTPYDLSAVAQVAAVRLPPSRAAQVDQIAERLRADRRGDRRAALFEWLAGILHLRHDMIRELA